MNRSFIAAGTTLALILVGIAAAIWHENTPELTIKADPAPLYEVVGELGEWRSTPHNVILTIPNGTKLQAIWTYDVKHYLIYHVRFDGKEGYLIIGDAVPTT